MYSWIFCLLPFACKSFAFCLWLEARFNEKPEVFQWIKCSPNCIRNHIFVWVDAFWRHLWESSKRKKYKTCTNRARTAGMLSYSHLYICSGGVWLMVHSFISPSTAATMHPRNKMTGSFVKSDRMTSESSQTRLRLVNSRDSITQADVF